MKTPTHTLPDSRTIACLGDSITAGYWDEEGLGYVARLSMKIARAFPLKFWVYNAGVSGDTTLDAWHNLISRVTHIEPDIVTIKVGVNDVCVREGIAPESHQSAFVDRMRDWNKILDYCGKMGWKTLIIGALPVEADVVRLAARDDVVPGHVTSRYANADILHHNDILEKLCKQRGVPFLRLYEDWLARRAEGLFLDGLHPNAKGHALLAEQVFGALTARGFL